MAQTNLAGINTRKNLGYAKIEDRQTEELIFAFVEPIGGGAARAATTLEDILKNEPYKYEVNKISTRDIINEEVKIAQQNDKDFKIDDSNLKSVKGKEIYYLQEKGNFLRKKYGNDFLAKQIIRKIAKYRHDHDGYEQPDQETAPAPKSLRVAHIIRSLKHEAELEKLKSIYKGIFFVIAITGDYETRLQNFDLNAKTEKEQKQRETDFEFLSEKDQYEGLEYGQRVRKVFHLADFFIDSSINDQEKTIKRFIELLFGQSILTPHFHERMMHTAYTASLMSLCLSRQVGAALASESKELLGVGWNDIPRLGGGLSSDEENLTEHKSLCKYKGYCNTNKKIDELIESIFNKLQNEKIISCSLEKFNELMKNTPITNLIEFSRSIHAEMAAILSVARDAKGKLRDATLYVTTYPCENCIKHILACGISRVYFIEPYPKSRAKEFFSEFLPDNAAVPSANSQTKKTLGLIQYSGVSPTAYELLYKAAKRKNENGELIKPQYPPKPKTTVLLDSYTIYENFVANEMTKNK